MLILKNLKMFGITETTQKEKKMVDISYMEDQGDRHPALKKVMLRLMDLRSLKIKKLFEFIGGQGTINVPSWSKDSKKFAFVSYTKN